MSEINMKDAPVGYIAVKPMGYLSNGNGSCYGCDFDRDDCFLHVLDALPGRPPRCDLHPRRVAFLATETTLEATICAIDR